MNYPFKVMVNIDCLNGCIEVLYINENGEWESCGPVSEWKHHSLIPRVFHEELDDEIDLTHRKFLEFKRIKKKLLKSYNDKYYSHINVPYDAANILEIHHLMNKRAWSLVQAMFEGYDGQKYMEWKCSGGDIEDLRQRVL